MTKGRDVWSFGVSRRCLLQRAACAAGAAALLGAGVNTATAGQLSQAAVGYQGSPKGSQSCGKCRLFRAPSSCKSVAGSISPNGWCSIFVPA
jgi:hypothetical protein